MTTILFVARCPKRRYREEIDAKIALASTHASRSARRNETRAYHCPDCTGWHLTSRSKA